MAEDRRRRIAELQRQMRRRLDSERAVALLARIPGLRLVRFVDDCGALLPPVDFDYHWDSPFRRSVRPFARLPLDAPTVERAIWLDACATEQLLITDRCYLQLPNFPAAPWIEVAILDSVGWLATLWEQLQAGADLRIANGDKSRIAMIVLVRGEYLAYWLENKWLSMPADLDAMASLWTHPTGDYVLLDHSGTGDPTKAIVYDVRTPAMMIIEDEDLAAEVKRRMAAAGVPIVNEVPPVAR